MVRRWYISLTTLALAVGSVLAAGSASAAAAAHHPGPSHITPGGMMVRPASNAAGPSARGVRHQVESTNWSGYAVTGGSGAC